MKSLLLALVLVLATACGPEEAPKGTQVRTLATSSGTCETWMKVYKVAPSRPGGSAQCACALKKSDPDGSNRMDLLVLNPDGPSFDVKAAVKGTGPNQYNDSWAAAGCP